jgi:hypothetical protein
MAPRVHQVAARQKTRRAAGIEIASRRKTFIVPPYMLGCGGPRPRMGEAMQDSGVESTAPGNRKLTKTL